MGFFAGFDASLALTSTPAVAISNMLLQDSGDGLNWTVTPANASKVRWDKSASFSFEVSTDSGSTWGAITPKTVKFPIGTVQFATSQAGKQIRVKTGSYLPYSLDNSCKGWSLDLALDKQETTVQLGKSNPNRRFRTYIPTLNGGKISLDRLYTDGATVGQIFAASRPLLIATCYTGDSDTSSIVCYGVLTSTPVESPVDGVAMNNLELMIDGEIYIID